MQIAAYSDCSKLDLIEEAWNRLGKQGLFFVPNFSKLRGNLEGNGAEFRIVVAIDNSQIMAIACFIYVNGRREYQIGRRKLFDLPVRVVHLFGSCVVGEPDEDITRQFFDLIIKEGNFDVISVGNIFVEFIAIQGHYQSGQRLCLERDAKGKTLVANSATRLV